jgi:Flp pilus assembly protein TadG
MLFIETALGSRRRPSRRRTGQRGAAVVELMIPFVPMLLMLFCFAECMRAAGANIALQHSASVGVRAAAVFVNSNPNDPGRASAVNDAVNAALGRWAAKSFFDTLTVTSTVAPANATDPNAMDTVHLDAAYACAVPLARHIICAGGPTRMKAQASFPHQGAHYLR